MADALASLVASSTESEVIVADSRRPKDWPYEHLTHAGTSYSRYFEVDTFL